MDAGPSTAAGAGGGGGGPAPFLLKTYDMVDDSSTDEIVSWSSSKNSFVVWNPPEFARLLLPTYFKHNNFSSFIRQLNTYGFRKIDPEKWEFANEDFVKDQKHLLKNIHRRKPIHSHSNPQGSLADPERAAFDEQIERLSRDKAKLEATVAGFEQQRTTEKAQLEEFSRRVDSLEQRQDTLLAYIEKAIQNPSFVELLARKMEALDFSAYNKKRRLPQADQAKTITENSLDNHVSSRAEGGNVIHQDFCNKLRLELSPAVSDINLVSHSTQSSNEDGSPQMRISEGDLRSAQTRTLVLPFAPETLELSDTGTSYTCKVDSVFPRNVSPNESPGLHCLNQELSSNEEVDGHVSCHLNLTLASSPLQVNKSSYPARTPQVALEAGKSLESNFNGNGTYSDTNVIPEKKNVANETPNNKQGPAAAPARVNDVFWEQFLTERPGSSDNEEACSNYRAHPYDEQEERQSSYGVQRNNKSMEQLSL
ncbi:hypothetical protein Tsubulata_002572 [Turnera subulata]|uniref:HSF-type DNA-binding domain-containing protein n=1 Tax=Turnera subulata TaxID=218843 RepID=A0A9Q0GA93_9ROSI|nr:hypothetical protein Tsubulata_002572 [Turnera subulata]